MGLNEMRPAAWQSGSGLGNAISSAAISPENSTHSRIVNRLRSRLGLSTAVASLIATLAGLGPQEAR